MAQNTKYADKLRKEFIELVTADTEVEYLAQQLNNTEETAESYKSRVILELIQNMDDQGKDVSIQGLIKIEGSNLIVCNQGIPFSEEGIKSLHTPNLSSKKANTGIGNKGLGFRGVLNFVNKVQIFSGDFAVEFSEDIANKYYQEIKSTPQIQKIIKKRGDKPTYLPMLSTPVNIDYAPERQPNGKFNIDGCEYDTYIKMHFKDDQSIQDIIEQIQNFTKTDSVSLLFLNALRSITFKYADVCDTCSANQLQCKENADNKNITKWEICKPNNDGQIVRDRYYMHKRPATVSTDDTDCRNDIAVCFPEQIAVKAEYNLFAFFPMLNQPCDFPVILHADKFRLEPNRDALKKGNPENKLLLKDLLDLLIDTAVYFAKPEYGTMAMDMVRHDVLKSRSPFFELKDVFYKKLCNSPIVLTLQSEYKPLNDRLRVCPTVFEDCKNVFQRIDKTISKDIQRKLPDELQSLALEFTPDELYDEINDISYQFDSDTRALLFYDWKVFCPYRLMPKILKNTNGEFFTYNSEQHDKICLMGTDKEILDMPVWSKSYIVDISDKKALYDNINKLGNYTPGKHKAREISDKYPHDLADDDLSNLLQITIGNKIGTSYNRAMDFVVFLLKNLPTSAKWNEKGDHLNFPTIDKTAKEADNLYFGETYDNPDAKLCSLFGLTEFIPLNELKAHLNFDITAQQIKDLLGGHYFVQEHPIVPTHENATNIVDNKYKQKCIDIIQEDIKDINSITTLHITNLENALNAVQNTDDTICILDWLNNPAKIYHIKSNHMVRVLYTPNKRGPKTEQTFPFEDNYDRFLLYNTPWLFIDDKHYAPRELLLKSTNENIKAIPTQWLAKYKDLFESIGVKSNIWETDDDVFYDILLQLPEFDKTGSISRQIYNNLSNNYSRYNTSVCAQKQEFLATGKLFAKNTSLSKGEFRSIKEVKFASFKPIHQGKYWLIDKNYRNGNADEFKKIFGIDKYEENINITKTTPHEAQAAFDRLWSEFEPFVEIYATKNQDLQLNLRNLRIQIVSSIENDNTPVYDIEDYYQMQGKTKTQQYIYLSPHSKLEREKLCYVIGDILNILANSKDEVKTQISLLFMASNDEARWNALESFGYDTSDNRNRQFVKESFIKAVGQSAQSVAPDIDAIDFANINSTKSVAQIIDVLRARHLTYQDIKANGFESDINFNTYHYNKVMDKLASTEEAYKGNLYLKLKNATEEQQQHFFADIDERNNVHVSETDIDCDYKKYCPDIQPTDVDVTQIFHKNRETFHTNNSMYSDEDLENLNLVQKAMILFEQYENLEQSLAAQHRKETAERESKESQQQLVTYTIDTDDSDVKAVSHPDDRHHGQSQKTGRISGAKLAQKRVKNGDDAEEAVFKALKADAAYTAIDWVSSAGYRKKYGTANDDSRGYDMTYIKDNKIYYAEVKSVSVNGKYYEFFISNNEREFAKKHMADERYVFILVLPDNKIKFIHKKEKIQEILDSAVEDSIKCTITI